MKCHFKLREYQATASNAGLEILKEHEILILNFQVRTGKTHIALDIAKHYNNVLFVTKKKAIGSIEADYKTAEHSFDITVINYESLHKVKGSFDLVIADESHGLGAFPKPSKRTKELKQLVSNDLILMTGTLTPESNAQLFHQLWVSKHSPFKNHKNFYQWHKTFGTPKLKHLGHRQVADYSDVKYDKIKGAFKPFTLTKTQGEAGFKSTINEEILTVEMKPSTYKLCDRLKKDLVIEGDSNVILADTGVKLMQKLHQMYSGTVKFESGDSMVFDNSKAVYIWQHFRGRKLAIFYKFKEELNAIKEVLDITDNIEEFNTTDKHIALQIVSGREGINLSKADYIVYYNIDFSAVSYWQSRDRMTTIERAANKVYWLFSKGGIEHKIYKSVLNKKNYTIQSFKRDLDGFQAPN